MTLTLPMTIELPLFGTFEAFTRKIKCRLMCHMEGKLDQLQRGIKELRRRMGWTQEDLAREISVSLSTVQRWENRGANPTRLARREIKKYFQKAGIGGN